MVEAVESEKLKNEVYVEGGYINGYHPENGVILPVPANLTVEDGFNVGSALI